MYRTIPAVVVMVAVISSFGIAHAQQDVKHVWVFVVDSACDFDAGQMKADIQSIPAYAPYMTSLDVVCFPNAPMLDLPPVVSVLKQAFPEDVFVFWYDARDFDNKLDWQRFAIAHYGKYEEGLYGKAFINEGYAATIGAPHEIAHEATHLVLKAIHGHGTNRDDPATWTPA